MIRSVNNITPSLVSVQRRDNLTPLAPLTAMRVEEGRKLALDRVHQENQHKVRLAVESFMLSRTADAASQPVSIETAKKAYGEY